MRDQCVSGDFARSFVWSAIACNDIRYDVSLIRVSGEMKAQILEIMLDSLLLALVDEPAVAEEHQVIDHFKDLDSRLMDDDNDRYPKLGKGLEDLHHG